MISIMMIIAAFALCTSGTSTYIQPLVKKQLVSVSDLRSALSEFVISFNFTISVPGALLHLDVFDIVGTPNDEARWSLFKTRVDINGKLIQSTSVVPRCESCYDAETKEKKCYGRCDDIVEAYQTKHWSIREFASWNQCKADNG